jgi:hypothetical protein
MTPHFEYSSIGRVGAEGRLRRRLIMKLFKYLFFGLLVFFSLVIIVALIFLIAISLIQ